MSQITKRALAESLKKLLLEKPLDRITVSDITEDCGVSRMTFYYHFKDVYDLIEWTWLQEAERALDGPEDLRYLAAGVLADIPAGAGEPGVCDEPVSLHQPGAGGALSL